VPELEISDCGFGRAWSIEHRAWNERTEDRGQNFDCGLGILSFCGAQFSKCSFECCDVDVTGEMNGTLSVDGIPTRRIC
jgi:hypothetical protein